MKKNDNIKWKKITLKDMASYFNDGDWVEKRHQDSKGYWLVQTGNVGIIQFKQKEAKRYVNEDTFIELKCKEIFGGDILVSRLPDPVGRSCIFPSLSEKAITAVDCTIIRLKKDYVSEYVNFLINSGYVQDPIKKYLSGSSRIRISRKNLETISIPIPFVNDHPDTSKQREIVDKIQEVISLCDFSEHQFEETQKLIDSLCNKFFENHGNSKVFHIGEICDVVKGVSPTLKTLPGEYPLVVTAEDRKSANTFQFDDESVCIPLVSSTGHGHASMKRIHYQEGKFALANIMVGLFSKDKNKLLPKYLYYYLTYYKDSLLVTLMRGGANVTIPMKEIYDVPVRIPEIDIQEKFLGLINEIESIQRIQGYRKTLNK